MITNAPPREGFNAFATVFCCCGWLMWQAENGTVLCNNPACGHYGDLYKVDVELVRVELEQHLA